MKKQIFICATILAFTLLAAVSTFAAARAPSNSGRDYVNGARSLANWSIGIYAEKAEKDLVFKDADAPSTRTVKSSKVMAYVGYDALPWLTPYLALGTGNTEVQYEDSEDKHLDAALGLQLNLLDHEIADPFLLEDHFRLNGSVEYTRTSLSVGDENVDLGQWDAYLTAAIVNDIVGSSEFSPESIAVFFGPAYSTWVGSGIEGSRKSSDDFGFTVGMELFYSPSISMNLRANLMEHRGISAGLNVHF
jgi:opacity protein-like surface antigen